MPTDHPILFFDGICNLCNKWVDYVISHDHSGQFKFASLQSDYAKEKLAEHQIDNSDLNTVILLHEGKVYKKSKAAAKIMILLGGWKAILGHILHIIPTPLSNLGYDIIARNRYKLHGKRETCRLPSEEERDRFLG